MAFTTSCTLSPTLRSSSWTDSVVNTDAMRVGAVTSNFTNDMMASLLMEVTLAVILFLAPYFMGFPCYLWLPFELNRPVMAAKHKVFRRYCWEVSAPGRDIALRWSPPAQSGRNELAWSPGFSRR